MLTLNWLNNLFTKKITRKSLALAGLFCVLSLAQGCDLFSGRVLSKPVIKIQDHELSLQMYSKLLARRLKNLDPLSAKDPLIVKKFKDRILSDFIIDSFVEIWFSESKQVFDKKLFEDQKLAVTQRYPTDAAFRTALAEEEVSYSEWSAGEELLLKRKLLFKELQKKIDPISDSDIKSYYESNKPKFFQKETLLAKSILVSDESQSDVIKKLSKKTAFEKLIQDYSIETPKPKDGIFAWVERDASVELDILFVNKKSELIGPIKMNEGLRLFKVAQRRPARQRTLEEVSAQIKNEILSLRESARFSAWLDEQTKRYTIYKNKIAIDAVFVETKED